MKTKFFIAIIALAAILRFYKLGVIPPSLDWDENSNAYNAYSILKTGRDEYGKFLPLFNRSFDDYKPPIYMYLNLPTVAIFGLTPFAARLPAALFGFLTVPAFYFLVKKLFDNEDLSLLAMFFLSVSPWHVHFSRVGFEATVGLFFAVLTFTAFLYGLTNKKLALVAAFLIGVCAYTYHTERVFVPLLLLMSLVIFRKEILKIPKKFIVVLCTIAAFTVLPLLILVPKSVIFQRFDTTSQQANLEDVQKSINYLQEDKDTGFIPGKIFDNRRIVIAKTYMGNYLSHFDPNFLFLKGDDNFRHHIQDMGMLYLFELPLVLIGLYSLLKNISKSAIFILSWLIIAPVAAAVAHPAPHAIRSFPMVIPLEFLSAYAIFQLRSIKFSTRRFVTILLLPSIFMSIFVYLYNYYQNYPTEKSTFWQYGYSQAAQYSWDNREKYDKIVIDKSIEQGYAFWLFTLKYDPKKYQQEGSARNFDKFYFDGQKLTEANILFISDPKRYPQNYQIIKTIFNLDGTPAVVLSQPVVNDKITK